MSILRFIRIFGVLLLVITGLIACKTTPEETEEPVPSSETKPEVETKSKEKVDEPTPAAKEEVNLAPQIEEARKAVRRASVMGANEFFPKEYRSLVATLENAISMEKSDPDRASSSLSNVIRSADELYGRALMARKEDYEKRYYRADSALMELGATHFAPDEYTAIRDMAMMALGQFESGALSASQETAFETLKAQAVLHHNLSRNIRYIKILIRDSENYISDAEDNEAYLYAREELDTANEAYIMGQRAFDDYDINQSAEFLSLAKQKAIIAARVSAIRRKQTKTDALMLDTQRRIEQASKLQVLNNDGSLEESRQWNGSEYLERNPLVDHSENVAEVEIEEPMLRRLDTPIGIDEDGDVPVDIPIDDEDVLVNADEQSADYLNLAESMWQKGVVVRNEGQFELADEYFNQARAYIKVHESNAVGQSYTVQYRKVATDCLWRIAAREEIFDNAYLWPKIWRSNRRVIQNPDLIYPGQVLIIPPN